MATPDEKRMTGTSGWTVDELISTAERIMASDPRLFAHSESETNKELNVRLIRDYVVRELIPRPERVGREARFGLDHLVQLLSVRFLLRSQKWSLPAIKSAFATTSTDNLLNGPLASVSSLIEAEHRKATGEAKSQTRAAASRVRTLELNPAQLLIKQFRAAKQNRVEHSDMPLFSKAPRAMPLASMMATLRTGDVSRKLHVQLEPGCEVVIDAQRMKSLTPEEVERLGEALKSRLRDETAR
jgi:hypothetical protein